MRQTPRRETNPGVDACVVVAWVWVCAVGIEATRHAPLVAWAAVDARAASPIVDVKMVGGPRAPLAGQNKHVGLS